MTEQADRILQRALAGQGDLVRAVTHAGQVKASDAAARVMREANPSPSRRVRSTLIAAIASGADLSVLPADLANEMRAARRTWSQNPTPVETPRSDFSTVTARARLDLGMGGIGDLPPVDGEICGTAVSMPLGLRGRAPVSCCVRSLPEGIVLTSVDLGVSERFEHWGQVEGYRGPLALLAASAASVNRIRRSLDAQGGRPLGVDLTVDVGIGVGSGLGVSGAIVHAVVNSVAPVLGVQAPQSPGIALDVEMHIGALGGWEDVVAASIEATLGFSRYSSNDGLTVRPMHMDSDARRELAACLTVARTPSRRTRRAIGLERALVRYFCGDARAVRDVRQMNDMNSRIATAAASSDVAELARLTQAQWEIWVELIGDGAGKAVVARAVDAVGSEAVLGAKLCGAGEAGHVAMFTRHGAQERAHRQLLAAGFEPLAITVG